jgi:TolB protein
MKQMNKTVNVLAFVAFAVLLVGCVTRIHVTSNPDHADVRRNGKSLGTTPYDVQVSQLASWSGELRKEGYLPKPISLSAGGATNVQFTLEKDIPKIALNSVPSGAEAYSEAGDMLGTTPITISVTNNVQNYELRLVSYESKKVTVTPSSPRSLEINMGAQIQGMVLPELLVKDKGLQVEYSTVFADRDVIEKSPSVRAVQRLTDLPRTRWVGSSTLSPDGKQLLMDVFDQEIAPDKTTTKFSNLWGIDVGGGGSLRRYTEGNYIDEAPCFSPDGQKVYFASSRAGKNAIFRLNREGKGLGLVTPGTTIDRFPQVSPDGQTLLWTAFTEGTTIPQLWSLQLANGLPTGLPTQLREGQAPHWSPDGKIILYSVLDRNINKWKIWTLLADGSQPTQITTGSDSNDIHPCWLPDGSKILFASDRGVSNGKPNYDIWIMNADGSNQKQLTTNGSRDDHPIVSPDGKTIFFRSNRGLKWDIWVMEIAEESAVSKK